MLVDNNSDFYATDALRDVVLERERQKSEEGWSEEHDDQHYDGSLAAAAGCYALHASLSQEGRKSDPKGSPRWNWPRSWAKKWWKPSNPRRELVKAGALILAEIERLDRQNG